MGGVIWDPLFMKILQSNICLYLSRGSADYVTILDVDEFFIPKNNYSSFADVINSAKENIHSPLIKLPYVSDSFMNSWKGGSGWADKDAHPYCFLSVASEIFLQKKEVVTSPWIGDKFHHGTEYNTSLTKFVKSNAYNRLIIPTETIYYTGINLAGACKLSYAWTECSDPSIEFCVKTHKTGETRRLGRGKGGEIVDFRTDQNFDEIVTGSDGKLLDKELQATVYHYSHYNRRYISGKPSKYGENDYTKRFFQTVLSDIKKRDLDLVVEISEGPKDDLLFPGRNYQPLYTNTELRNLSSSFSGEAIAIDAFEDEFGKVEALPHLDRYINRTSINGGQLVILPNFMADYSDFLTGALIERVSDSWDLYVTSFFICHKLLEYREGLSAAGGLKVHPDTIPLWQQALNMFEKTEYKLNGIRDIDPMFSCRIRNSYSDKEYIVDGMFIPNDLTPDSNSNRRFDILRCKMQNTKEAYMTLAGSTSEYVYVEIMQGSKTLIKYKIPWSTRSTGYMLSPPYEDRNANEKFSRFDYWKGFNRSTPGVWTHDHVYMCVPGSDLPLSKENIPHYLEFIQHHILLGVEHIFIAVDFSWESIHMKTLLRILESYIASNQVSITSHAGDQVDMVFSLAGMALERDNLKNLHTNMCNYFSKGIVDYTAVWDFDEYFIPTGKNKNLLDMIYSMDPYTSSGIPYFHKNKSLIEVYHEGWKGGPGLADGDAHPLCSITLDSSVLFYPFDYEEDRHELDKFGWMGDRFPHDVDEERKGLAFKKSIRPTRVVFQGGLHMVGACRLAPEWNGCSEHTDLCLEGESDGFRLTKLNDTDTIHFNLNHRFDDKVLIIDVKSANIATDGVIYHMQFHRHWFKSSDESSNRTNLYSGKYFKQVLIELDKKDLLIPFFLPENNFDGKVYDTFSNRIISSMYGSISSNEYIIDSDNFMQNLPCKSNNNELLILSSLIERNYHSFELNILVNAIRKVSSIFNNITYFCHIRNNANDQLYISEAIVLNRQISVGNTDDDHLLIFKCKLKNAEESYFKLNDSFSGHVYVELRQIEQSEEKVLLKYRIPWKTRGVGYLLDPPFTDLLNIPYHYWKGFDRSDKDVWSKQDKHYILTNGIEIPPNDENIHVYLEFIQHHLLLGIDMIIIILPIGRESMYMLKIMGILKSFIFEKKVMIISSLLDSNLNINLSDNFKLDYFHSLYFHLSKGLTEYVSIQSINQFFIPSNNEYNKMYGFLDRIHYCSFYRNIYIPSDEYSKLSVLSRKNWLGTIFSDNFYNGTIEFEFDRKNGIIVSTKSNDFWYNIINNRTKIHLSESDGVLYNYPLMPFSVGRNKNYVKIKYNKYNQPIIPKQNSINLYSTHYFNATFNALKKKNLDLIVDIPLKIHYDSKLDNLWRSFKSVYDNRKSVL